MFEKWQIRNMAKCKLQSFYFTKDLRITKRPCAILMFKTPLLTISSSLYVCVFSDEMNVTQVWCYAMKCKTSCVMWISPPCWWHGIICWNMLAWACGLSAVNKTLEFLLCKTGTAGHVFILRCQYHGCWWADDARSQDVSSHDIDVFHQWVQSLSTKIVKFWNPFNFNLQASMVFAWRQPAPLTCWYNNPWPIPIFIFFLILVFWLKFHWCLFPSVQWTITQRWFR